MLIIVESGESIYEDPVYIYHRPSSDDGNFNLSHKHNHENLLFGENVIVKGKALISLNLRPFGGLILHSNLKEIFPKALSYLYLK